MAMSFIAVCYELMATKICKRGFLNSRNPLHVLTAVTASFLVLLPFSTDSSFRPYLEQEDIREHPHIGEPSKHLANSKVELS